MAEVARGGGLLLPVRADALTRARADAVTHETASTLVTREVYRRYTRRQEDTVAAFRNDETRALAIPTDVDYDSFSVLSNEERDKLKVRLRSTHARTRTHAAMRWRGVPCGGPHLTRCVAQEHRPTTVHAASRIQGMSPDTLFLLARIARHEASKGDRAH